MSEGSVEIKDLVKTYADDRGRPTFTALKNISLPSQDGESMVLVGPSSCGRPTTLRAKITSGTISIGGRVVNELETKAGTGNLIARIHDVHLYQLGETVTVRLNTDKVNLFDAATENVMR